MTEGLSVDGQVNDRLVNLYQQWSMGGAGLIISGNVMIDRRFLERPGNVIIDQSSDKNLLKRWAHAGKLNGSRFWLQISHPGRQCTKWVNRSPLAPSEVSLDLLHSFAKPRALLTHEIEQIIQRFAVSAKIAEECGFDGVQIHGAHGYLISQFLSPITNQRTDEWGGNFDNRMRFLQRVIEAVRSSVSSQFAVGLKLNSSDFQKGGYSIDDCINVINVLNDYPLDLIELSGGTYEQPQLLGHHGDKGEADLPKRDSTIAREAYFVNYAKQVRQVAKIPLMVTGGFETITAMNEALTHVDFLGLARPFCVMPDWPNQLKQHELKTLPRPEKKLLGHGLLGPTSPFQMIQGINIQGEVAWFYYQIIRLSDKKSVKWNKKLLGAFLFHVIREQWLAYKRRKQLIK
jgi:2,4-dienoyl-CoA reductase-like NADH-dependent reductase (Old Yellow Enzyme family)